MANARTPPLEKRQTHEAVMFVCIGKFWTATHGDACPAVTNAPIWLYSASCEAPITAICHCL
jgi:hypothetical protein